MDTAGMIEYGGAKTALAWHLSHNHYPPVPASMIPVCEAAIDLAVDEDWKAEVELPEGVSYKGRSTAPVWAIVESHHLGAFVEAVLQADTCVCEIPFVGHCDACRDI